jgi:hypothetical protein
MEKYIAFDLYQKNDQGGHVMAKRTPLTGDEVYLASEVKEALQKYGQHLDGCEAGSTGIFDENREERVCSCGFDSLMER